MLTFLRQRLPLWQVVRPLFLDVCLSISPVSSCKLLGDGILDFDAFDRLVQSWQRVDPRIREQVSEYATGPLGLFGSLTIPLVG